MKKPAALYSGVKAYFFFDVLGGCLACILGFLAMVPLSYLPNSLLFPLVGAVMLLVQFGWFFGHRDRLGRSIVIINGVIAALSILLFTGLMIFTSGNTQAPQFMAMEFIQYPLLPLWLLSSLMSLSFTVFGSLILSILGFVWPLVFTKTKLPRKAVTGGLAVLMAISVINILCYVNRPQVKYGGHGFDYMHGYSTTDFKDYMVYSEPSRLAELSEPSSLRIDSNYPIMDGAEACYPLYAAVAKACYADIAQIEQDAADRRDNGEYVKFTNSVQAYKALATGGVDLFFGAKPSADQLEDEEFHARITPIGREAFVFFVEKDNPLDDISSADLRKIYSGEITNWQELGGRDEAILAFQRPRYSGSQTMMEYFMGDIPLKEPESFEYFGGMGEVVSQVAQYHSEAGAMGYSFRYFVEELNQEDGVKLLKIDGVAPTLENIENGSYPLTVPLCLVTDENTRNDNVQRVIDFMLSPQGQELVRKTGYGGLG